VESSGDQSKKTKVVKTKRERKKEVRRKGREKRREK